MSEGQTDISGSSMDGSWDVMIVGGGPAGMASAIYSARGGLRTIVIDKDKGSGAMGGPHTIANYPGFPQPVEAQWLLERFREQAVKLGAVLVQDNIVYTDLRTGSKLVASPTKEYRGRAVILATGSMGRSGTIEGESRFIGRGVHYCAICDGPNMAGKHVAVIGQVTKLEGELELLSSFASKISVFSASGSFDEDTKAFLAKFEKASPMPGVRVSAIAGGDLFTGLMVKKGQEGEIKFDCDAVFVYLSGNRPVTDYIVERLEKGVNGCIKVLDDGSTSLNGVFAVGDISCREVRQVSLAVAEGMKAALSARAYINGSKVVSQWGEE